MLGYIAILNRSSYEKFAQTFRDTVKQDFTVFYRRLFPDYAQLLDVVCTALSQPVILVADLIRLAMSLNDSVMLSQICCVFRDYFWKGLKEAFDIYGDISKISIDGAEPEFCNNFLILWGLN